MMSEGNATSPYIGYLQDYHTYKYGKSVVLLCLKNSTIQNPGQIIEGSKMLFNLCVVVVCYLVAYTHKRPHIKLISCRLCMQM